MGGKVKLPPELADLLRSDLERAIYEAALHRDDDLIARRCIIEKSAQVDVAAELGWDRSTVSHHLSYIMDEVKRSASRIAQKEGVGLPTPSHYFDWDFLFAILPLPFSPQAHSQASASPE